MYGKFSIIEASGTPYEIGFKHGSLAKEKVLGSIETYKIMFKQWSSLDWEEAKIRSSKYVKFVEEADPDLIEEVRGVADGAGVSFEDIMTLNARSEVVFAQHKTLDGCTAFSCTPEATKNGHVLIGQNWDWKEQAIDNLIILKIKQRSKPDIFMVTEAGIIGKIGFNSTGLGVCLNALVVAGEPNGIPLHFVLRRILDSPSINSALDKINTQRNAGPGNYLMAYPDGCSLTVEKTPEAWDYLYNDTGILVHTNHIISKNLQLRIKDDGPVRLPDTIIRYHMMQKMMNNENGNITVDYIKSCLRSHHQFPEGICHHVNVKAAPSNQFTTAFSIIMDINTSEVWLTLGPPCESEYQHYRVNFD